MEEQNNEIYELDVDAMTSLDLLEHYKIVALALYKAHRGNATTTNKMAIMYNVITILITSITGSASLSLLFEEYQSLKIINVILSYIVVVLGTIYRYYSPDKRCEQHRLAAENYIRLYYEVVEMLIFNEINVATAKNVNQQLEALREKSPYIDDNLYNKYKHICGNVHGKHKRVMHFTK